MSEDDRTEFTAGNTQSDFDAGFSWLRSVAAMCAAIFRLGVAEMSLAKEDLGRLMLVSLLIVPVFFLTWIAISVLVAWIVYELSMSATLGFATFAAIQLVTTLILVRKLKTYRRSLTLPATRAQISMILQEVRHETRKSTYTDRGA